MGIGNFRLKTKANQECSWKHWNTKAAENRGRPYSSATSNNQIVLKKHVLAKAREVKTSERHSSVLDSPISANVRCSKRCDIAI